MVGKAIVAAIGSMLVAGFIYTSYRCQELHSELLATKETIYQLRQSQKLADDASQKYQERKEALKNEQERQQKITSEALDQHKDWSSQYLPDSILRMFSGQTTEASDLPATDGAAQ